MRGREKKLGGRGWAERGDRSPDGEAERCDFTSISARLHERGMQDEGWKRHCLKWQLGASAEQGGFHDFMSDNDCTGNHVRHDDKDVYQSWRWHENGGR